MSEKREILVEVPGLVTRKYPIFIGTDAFTDLEHYLKGFNHQRQVILTDASVADLWLERFASFFPDAQTIIVAPGESAKTLGTLEQICSQMLELGCDRSTLLLNLGGGVIGDMGGFAAAMYMRGIDFVQVPTTLLSQVDASVGGKTAVNLPGMKNAIGSFHQPLAVCIATETLTTLSPRLRRSGMAEVLKHGFIRDAHYLERVVGEWGSDAGVDWTSCIADSCEIKSAVVQEDEKESGVRKLLNFGHTAGHALEAAALHTAYPMLHGEAISLGMLVEAELSERSGLAPEGTRAEVARALATIGLPVTCRLPDSYQKLLALMKKDKKNSGGAIRWTLLREIGVGVFDQKIDEQLLEPALRTIEEVS